jgi:hypothetical protein
MAAPFWLLPECLGRCSRHFYPEAPMSASDRRKARQRLARVVEAHAILRHAYRRNLSALLRRIERSDDRVWKEVNRIHDKDLEAARFLAIGPADMFKLLQHHEYERAMAAEIVAPALAGMTPGLVFKRVGEGNAGRIKPGRFNGQCCDPTPDTSVSSHDDR